MATHLHDDDLEMYSIEHDLSPWDSEEQKRTIYPKHKKQNKISHKLTLTLSHHRRPQTISKDFF
jgi:hypothetical protein